MAPERSEDPTPPDAESLVARVANRIFRQDAALWVTTMVAIAGGLVWAQSTLEGRVDRKVDAGIAPVERHVAEVEASLTRHAAESQRVHVELKEDMHELQQDIRALYRAVQTGQPQPRLEVAPSRDGGAP